ncbi:MAG: class I SAM-dependent methyltransferase [Nitrososphaeraceae archaeon]
MSEDQEFWKKYHLENDAPYLFSDKIKDVTKDLNISSVLEIGCGYGNNLDSFEGLENVVGIDISEYAIHIAKQRFPQFRFYVGGVLDIPLKEKFDLVFSSAVIQHVKPHLLDKAFKEIFRVSSRYILNIEAYDDTEHVINWYRGKDESWTIHVAKRWQKFPVKVLADYDVDDEYRLTLVEKVSDIDHLTFEKLSKTS